MSEYTARGGLGSDRPRELGPALQFVDGPLALRGNTDAQGQFIVSAPENGQFAPLRAGSSVRPR